MRHLRICLLAFMLVVQGTSRGLAQPTKSKPASSSAPRALRADEIDKMVSSELARGTTRIPKGARVANVRHGVASDVPATCTRVGIEITPPPRRMGRVSTTAIASFFVEAKLVAKVPFTVDLDVAPEALVFDVARGAALTLVVRRGLVEVATPAVAGADADVGDVIQVLLRPSGRAIRARVVANDRAIAEEDGAR